MVHVSSCHHHHHHHHQESRQPRSEGSRHISPLQFVKRPNTTVLQPIYENVNVVGAAATGHVSVLSSSPVKHQFSLPPFPPIPPLPPLPLLPLPLSTPLPCPRSYSPSSIYFYFFSISYFSSLAPVSVLISASLTQHEPQHTHTIRLSVTPHGNPLSTLYTLCYT